MPRDGAGNASRRRSRNHFEQDDDGAPLDDEHGTQAESSKRRRRSNSDDEEEDDEDDASEDAGPSTSRAPQTNGTTSSSSEVEEFAPGSIVRVSLKNFVTYEQADFFPGPNLNMVIGPNGTGKSSLVCAICIGLGFHPRHLGRSTNLKEYIKHGAETATIEIELKKKPEDRANYQVKVRIGREDRGSTRWWLNGKETNAKRINDMMRNLNIQVDNLCQFLPQDRVAEFAAATPVDLLQETIRAAAPPKMLSWQAQLRDLDNDRKALVESEKADKETLRTLDNRQEGQKQAVNNLRERETILATIRKLKIALPVAQYKEAGQELSRLKAQRKDAAKELNRLERESGPTLQAVTDKQSYARSIKIAISAKTEVFKDAEKRVKTLAAQVASATEDIKGHEDNIEAIRKSHDNHKKEVASCRSKITALKAQLKNKPPAFDAAEWNQKIRSEEHKLRELDNQKSEINAGIPESMQKGKEMKAEIGRLAGRINAFDTEEGKRLHTLTAANPEATKVWEWVKENQDQFEQEILAPPAVSCTIKDERYSDLVQSMLQRDDFTCFTAQNQSDYKKFSDIAFKQLGAAVSVRTCQRPRSAFQNPLSDAEAAALKFDGFAVDFIDGPDAVLAMLCAEKKLHLQGLALRDHNDDEFERIKDDGRISQWAAGGQSFLIRRRKEYGPNAVTVVTRNIRKGDFWNDSGNNSAQKEELQKKLGELQQEFARLKKEVGEIRAQEKEIDEQKPEIENTIEELRKEKSELQALQTKYQSIPNKIETEERNEIRSVEAMRDSRKQISDLNYKWDNAVAAKGEIVLRHATSLSTLHEAHKSVVEAQLCLIEAESDVKGLEARNTSILATLEEQKKNVEEFARQRAELRQHVQEVLVPQVAPLSDMEDAEKDEISRLAGYRQDEEGEQEEEEEQDDEGNPRQLRSAQLDLEIRAEEAKLEFTQATNPTLVQEYERRAQEIEKLQRKIGQLNEKLENNTAQRDALMGKFRPKLESLVRRINDAFAYNFEQINCAGEVRIGEHEDFEQWSLQVMVKFRMNEELQQLTAHRQSGGERAVSTIFFLMALQAMAQSPFRVVDEINQGMDPRNERMVHERMVEIACREHTSQYFLITPKLLTGLRYDRKMRVLCIASGARMPEEGKRLDFGRCLKVQKRLMGVA